MSNVYTSVEQLIGGTPLLALSRMAGHLPARVLVKLEYMNPTGSVKDRAALFMIEDAERRGLLAPGSVIIEPTSGNTGIGLCAVAAARGYRVIIVMPETMSEERRMLMRAYGAELVLTEGAKGMKGAIAKAEELAHSTPGAFIPGQFVNAANARAHYETTGPEILADTDGQVDVFVAGVGTGGTVTGTGRYLKEHRPGVRGCGGGTRFLPRALRRAARAAQNSGHRRGVHSGGAGYVGDRRGDPRGRCGRVCRRPTPWARGGRAGGHFLRRGAARGAPAGRARGERGQDHCGAPAGHGRAVSVDGAVCGIIAGFPVRAVFLHAVPFFAYK